MATQGAYVVSGSPFRYSSPVLALSHFLVPPTLYISLSAPTLPLLPPLPHPPIPWSPLPVRVPGEAGEGVRGGGVRVGSCAIVSPFQFAGGG